MYCAPNSALVAVVAAGLGRQVVGHGPRRGRADRGALGAVDRLADVLRDLDVLEAVRVGSGLDGLGRVGAEHGRDVDGRVLEHHVRRREVTDGAAGAGERNPRSRRDPVRRATRGHGVGVSHGRRGVDRIRCRHRRPGVDDRRGPVGERRRGVGDEAAAARVVDVVGVGQRLAVPVAVQTGVDRQAVIGGVGDQRCVRVREHSAVRLEEVEQIRHLLEVGGDVLVVPEEVHVVEDDVDHVLDPVAELAGRRCRSSDRRGGRRDGDRPDRRRDEKRAGGESRLAPGEVTRTNAHVRSFTTRVPDTLFRQGTRTTRR